MTRIPTRLKVPSSTKADNIIRYLLKNDDDNIILSDAEKKTLKRCQEIHGYRLQFHSKSDIVKIMKDRHPLSDRQCYNLIAITEEIFGTTDRANKEYERNFLKEALLKALKLAIKNEDSKEITRASLAYCKVAGLDQVVVDMPDFAALEQHKYLLNMPPQALEYLMQQLTLGRIDLSKVMPPPNIDLNSFEEAKEVDE